MKGWTKKLTAAELHHLRRTAGCRSFAQVERTVDHNAVKLRAWHKEVGNGPFHGCWDCLQIGRKLGLIQGGPRA